MFTISFVSGGLSPPIPLIFVGALPLGPGYFQKYFFFKSHNFFLEMLKIKNFFWKPIFYFNLNILRKTKSKKCSLLTGGLHIINYDRAHISSLLLQKFDNTVIAIYKFKIQSRNKYLKFCLEVNE